MYFSKESVIALYKKLSSLYPKDDIEQQGGTQFASEIKYFLATDYFKKQKGKACDVNVKDDKDFFVLSVGKTVLLSDDGTFLATKNFANSLGDSKDFDVGSNFFSANAVAVSKKTSEPQKFPNRHPQLLSITKGIVDTYSGGYANLANDKEYLGGSIKKYALLFLWLNRFSNFTSKDSVYNDSLFNLKKDFSSQLISSLQWSSSEVQKEIENLIENIELVETKPTFEKEDFVTELTSNNSFNSNDFNCIKVPLNVDTSPDKQQVKQKLVEQLNKIESAEKDDGFNLLSQLVLFGIQNGEIIVSNNISPNELASEATISDNYHQHIRFGIQIYNYAKNNKLLESVNFQNIQKADKKQETFSSPATPHTHPKQIILYGVPGCGKSHKISEMLKDKEQFKIDSEESQVVRTVFHPDYTNSDFVGQILPEVNDKKIEYNFVPGPFTKILAKALVHSENQYVLIIEEINRGNAAAIFGEIFQLLDRIKSGKTTAEKLNDGTLNTYGEGWSEYFFMNDEINSYVLKQANIAEDETSTKINGISFSANTGIRLPPNLSILATMNTSDQNVFTLDNAFQRRWNMEYISNTVDTKDEETFTGSVKNQYESTIGTTGVKWGVFRDVINDVIANPENSFSNAEDKQLGLFFIHADSDIEMSAGKIDEKDFSNKVLKYLWNDIFKREKSDVFADGIKTFGNLLTNFTGKDAFEKCFQGKIVEQLAQD